MARKRITQVSTGGDATRRSQSQRQAVVVGLVAATVAALVVIVAWTGGGGGGDGGVGSGDGDAAPSTPQGVRTFEVATRNHVAGPVAYPQTPPVGGDHDPTWQNCGFYGEPIVTERGVHSLEHGAVWITYRPALAADQVDILRRLAASQTYVLVSPWAGELSSPEVASAWGRQLTLGSASDPALAEFVRAFQSGPQTPEPGAPCTGGRSTVG